MQENPSESIYKLYRHVDLEGELLYLLRYIHSLVKEKLEKSYQLLINYH